MRNHRRWILLLLLWLVACSANAAPATVVPSPTDPIDIAPAPTSPVTLPPPTATLLATSTPAPSTYTVQPGDVLGAIAQKFDISVETLAQANHITDFNLIHIGDVLIIPRDDTHTGGSATAPTVVVADATPSISTPASVQSHAFEFSPLQGDLSAAYPLTQQGANYTVHYQPDSFAAANITTTVEFIATARQHINTVLGVDDNQPFDIYLADTFFAPPDAALRGRAFSAQRAVFVLYDGSGTPAERRYMLTHELTHLIAWNNYGAPRSAMLSEGTAVAAGERFLVEEPFLPVHSFCLAYQRAGQLPQISSPALPLQGHLLNLPAYYASGCFVKFLIDRYGVARLKQVYRTADYAAVYGKSLAQLEEMWRADLAADQTPLPVDSQALSAAYARITRNYQAFFDGLDKRSFEREAYQALDRQRIRVMQGRLP